MSDEKVERQRIALRAAQAIRQQAWKRGTSYHAEEQRIGLFDNAVYKYERRKTTPSAISLQKLHNAGYDVIWILTGEERK